DSSRIYMWAHSNGGQIALSVLEISQAKIPTTLWAPVSKPFPYSILYYTDEFDDYCKALLLELAKLEQDYDVNNFSISEYVDRIKAPIAIRQGTADIEVPLQWSDELVQNLKDHKIEVEYNVYPAADHNMLGSWEKAIERDIRFFNNGGKVEE
ncbi:MAG: prolyl oligopeptidase family serine peptidase, partial [Candidatus Atribacteria bacterium]|nr:prolyl oligopeptidase family serine peptidase [Candidatus Atribacteria bacterium]